MKTEIGDHVIVLNHKRCRKPGIGVVDHIEYVRTPGALVFIDGELTLVPSPWDPNELQYLVVWRTGNVFNFAWERFTEDELVNLEECRWEEDGGQ
jgi:hypothetical protein